MSSSGLFRCCNDGFAIDSGGAFAADDNDDGGHELVQAIMAVTIAATKQHQAQIVVILSREVVVCEKKVKVGCFTGICYGSRLKKKIVIAVLGIDSFIS